MCNEKCARILITVCPMPVKASDEFRVIADSLSKDFQTMEPIVIGQAPRNGGQLLRLSLTVHPAGPEPPPKPSYRVLAIKLRR